MYNKPGASVAGGGVVQIPHDSISSMLSQPQVVCLELFPSPKYMPDWQV